MMSTGRLALVTGASAGIGRAFAEHLAGRGFDLALVARREDRLEALAAELRDRHGITTIVIARDLSQRSAPREILAEIEARDRVVDVLVNNAGYALARGFRNTAWDDIADFLEVLAIGQLEFMHLLVPGMCERGYGRIVNVASLAAYAPEFPGSLYPAVKKFLVSASRACWMEHRGTGVHITAVCPGYTWSEFHDVLGNRKQMNSLPRFMWQTSEAVAREGWSACERNKPVVVTGIVNKFFRIVCHLLPVSIVQRIAPKATKRRRKSITPD